MCILINLYKMCLSKDYRFFDKGVVKNLMLRFYFLCVSIYVRELLNFSIDGSMLFCKDVV